MEIIDKPEKIYTQPFVEYNIQRKSVVDIPYYSKELIFEFAEWIGKNYYNYYSPKGSIPSWFEKNHSLDCNTEQLFKEFLKNRVE